MQVQNLEAQEDATVSEELEAESLDFGTTEYILISMWAMFTAGVFAILYKITVEADEELHSSVSEKYEKKEDK